MTGIHDDPNAQASLPGRAPAAQSLEQREVSPERREPEEDQTCASPVSEPRHVCIGCREYDADEQQQKHEEKQVEHPGSHAGSHACQLQLQDDVLRGLDRDPLGE